MQDIKLECTLDGAEYKGYKVLFDDRSSGVISWKADRLPAEGCWYTTVCDKLYQ